MTKFEQKLRELIETKPEGFSLGLDGTEYNGSGYGVGTAELTIEQAEEYANNYRYSPLDGKRVIGGWRDVKTSRIYIDKTWIIKDRDEAIRIARQFRQIAIWDFNKGEEIQIDYSGNDYSEKVSDSDTVYDRINSTIRWVG